jgi:hypothetical protein
LVTSIESAFVARYRKQHRKENRLAYELVREQEITQSYQFGKLGETSLHNGKTFDKLEDNSEVFPGRPDLDHLFHGYYSHGYNVCWLYTKTEGQPELVDCINLDGI